MLAVIVGGGAWLAYDQLLPRLSDTVSPDVEVTIPEGLTSFEIDAILAGAGVVPAGSLAAIAERDGLEGYLFPDTYRFLPGSDPELVAKRLVATFHEKADPVIGTSTAAAHRVIVARIT